MLHSFVGVAALCVASLFLAGCFLTFTKTCFWAVNVKCSFQIIVIRFLPLHEETYRAWWDCSFLEKFLISLIPSHTISQIMSVYSILYAAGSAKGAKETLPIVHIHNQKNITLYKRKCICMCHMMNAKLGIVLLCHILWSIYYENGMTNFNLLAIELNRCLHKQFFVYEQDMVHCMRAAQEMHK